MHDNDSDDKKYEQIRFDGGSIDVELMELRRKVQDVFGLAREQSVSLIPDDADAADWRPIHSIHGLIEEYDDDPVPLDDYEHEFDVEMDLEHTAYIYEEMAGEFSLRQAMDYSPLLYHLDHEPVDVAILEVTKNPREWLDLLDDARVMQDLDGEDWYHVIPTEEDADKHGDSFQWVNDWGDVTPGWCFDYIDQSPYCPTWINPEESETRLRYNESWREHAHTLTFVDADGEKHTYQYLSGVVDTYPDDSDIRPGDAAFDKWIRPLLQGSSSYRIDGWRSGHTGPSQTAEMSKVKSGWHSSMERSDQSDKINAITNGEAHEEFEWDFPVAVIFSKTSNVMSIGLDIYAPEPAHDHIRNYFEGTAAAPYHAGV